MVAQLGVVRAGVACRLGVSAARMARNRLLCRGLSMAAVHDGDDDEEHEHEAAHGADEQQWGGH